MRRALLLLALLAACGREAAEAPDTRELPSFRDRAVPIGSSVRGGIGDLAGDWEIVQSFPGRAFAAPGTHLRVEPDGDAAALRFDGPGGVRDILVRTGMPGRLLAADGTEMWVLWVDDAFRTAAVGTPDGSLGWVMHRPGQAAADRTAAAREVLDWSGYDLGRLAGS